MGELRQALQLAVKRPSVTAVAVVTLALGIGSTTSVFTLVSATLLDPLPFARPDRLVFAASADRTTGGELSVSYPDFLDWRGAASTFSEFAAFAPEMLTLGGDGAERVAGELVAGPYFRTLGVQPAIGRDLDSADRRSEPRIETVAVVSAALWQRRFARAPILDDLTLQVNGVTFDVVGVAPAGFRGLTDEADVWVPMTTFDLLHPSLRQYAVLASRGTRWHSVVGRLAEGSTIEGARRELATITDRLEQTYPDTNQHKIVAIVPVREALVGDLRMSLLVLFGAVGCVLLVACVNLANLLLAAGAARHLEFAVRRALGAGRGRLIRQLLLESGVVAVLGGAGGLLVTAWSVPLLVRISPVDLPSFVSPTVDGRVLLFAAVVSLGAALLFGLLPALRGSSAPPVASLRADERGGGASPGARHWRAAFVIIQVAGVFVLLIGAGLMLTSFQRVRRFDPGFSPERLLTMRLAIPESAGDAGRDVALITRIADAVRAVPGVRSAGLTSHVYFGQGYLTTRVVADGQSLAPGEEGMRVYRQFVTPGYFAALGLPVGGRGVTARDTEETPPVAVVSRSFARRLWPDADPVGHRFRFGQSADSPLTEVVGVVGDVTPRVRPLAEEVSPQVYTPMAQSAFGRSSPALLIRAEMDPAGAASLVREAIRSVAPDVPVYAVATIRQLLAERTALDRFSAWLMSLFGALALVLASVGVSGVMGQTVAHQRREIGIRIALGADPRGVVRRLVRQGLQLAVAGVAIGWVVSIGLTRVLAGRLYGVSPTDPGIFAMVALLLLGAVLFASYVPARRAAAIDPIDALRSE